jgi:small subunit ribosomal protein S16
MVKLRLTRNGSKGAPFYRIIAVDSKQSRDGKYIEQIGYYNPVKNPAEIKIDAELAKKWLAVGAQPTDTVANLFYKAGIAGVEKTFKKTAKDVKDEAIDAAVDAVVEDEAKSE